jgi:hypothetical protein
VGNTVLEARLPSLEKGESFSIGRSVRNARSVGESLAMAKGEEDRERCNDGHVSILGITRKRKIETGN